METEIVYTKTYPVGERSTLVIEVSRCGSTLLARPWLDTPGWDRAPWKMSTEQMLEALAGARQMTANTPEYVTCVSCLGKGHDEGVACGAGGCRSGHMECTHCNGTGEMPTDDIGHYEQGRAAALKRRDRHESQRAMCERLGVAGLSMAELSKIEAGRWAGIEQRLIDAVLAEAK